MTGVLRLPSKMKPLYLCIVCTLAYLSPEPCWGFGGFERRRRQHRLSPDRRAAGLIHCRQRPTLRERPWSSDSRTEEPIASSGPEHNRGPVVGEAIRRLGADAGPTVWTEFARIAREHPEAVNLGQGFPDWLPPPFAVDSLVEAVRDAAQSPHQYTRPEGHPNLVRQLAARYGKHLRRDVDPMAQIAVTVGASQALYLALQTLVGPGDEVVLFEPFFDLYANQIRLAGGTPVFVPLVFRPYRPDEADGSVAGGEWLLDAGRLRAALGPRTRAILLNSPHNPTGKVFTRAEMEAIAAALVECASPDCVVLSDEVYKYIVHAPPPERAVGESPLCRGHVHFAALPGMWERTLTVSSAGKTFSATGWQVGWCIGPERLVGPIQRLLPYVQFCASTVMQEALARALPRADAPYEGHASYYDYLRATYRRKRDLLAAALTRAGFAVPDYDATPGGGFFILARVGPRLHALLPTERQRAEPRPDWALCRWMAEEKGLLCIPSSPFFSPEQVACGASDGFVRIAFCKADETIEAAARALKALVAESSMTSSTATSGMDQNIAEASLAETTVR